MQTLGQTSGYQVRPEKQSSSEHLAPFSGRAVTPLPFKISVMHLGGVQFSPFYR